MEFLLLLGGWILGFFTAYIMGLMIGVTQRHREEEEKKATNPSVKKEE